MTRKPAPDLGARLRSWRVDVGFTIRQASEALHVPPSLVQKAETGGRARPLDEQLLRRMAALYGVSPDEVLHAAGYFVEQPFVDARDAVDRTFLRLVLHERLRPSGMDQRWATTFSTPQKRQWIEFARRLHKLHGTPEELDIAEILTDVPELPEEGQ